MREVASIFPATSLDQSQAGTPFIELSLYSPSNRLIWYRLLSRSVAIPQCAALLENQVSASHHKRCSLHHGDPSGPRRCLFSSVLQPPRAHSHVHASCEDHPLIEGSVQTLTAHESWKLARGLSANWKKCASCLALSIPLFIHNSVTCQH